MNDILKEIRKCIKDETSFRIGTRGICVDCWRMYDGTWKIRIPRSEVVVDVAYIEVKEWRLIGYACEEETSIKCLTVFLNPYKDGKITRKLAVLE